MAIRRPTVAVFGSLAAVALAVALLPVPPALAASRAAAAWRTVNYRGVSLQVPSAWPVFDLRRDPTRCVRFDRHAVYLGHQGEQPDCPAGLIGRTEALQVEPLDDRAVAGVTLSPGRTTVGGAPARLASGADGSHTLAAALPSLGVMVSLPYGSDRTLVDRILASVRQTGAVTPRPVPDTPPPASPDTADASIRTIYTGQGFDACTAPSTTTMKAWTGSPFHSLGTYIGGANRACSQANLTTSWVTSVEGMGWRLAPLWVGLQAPCTYHTGVAKIDPTRPADQGVASADYAATAASDLALGSHTPIYFDMEGYDTSNSSCDTTVEKFLSSWVGELHAKGLTAGVYGGASTTISQLTTFYDSATYHRPDDIWFAHWDGRVAVFGDPFFADSFWPNHQRMHQFLGGHDEAYGGVTINIDSNDDDARVAAGLSVAPIAFDSNRTGTRQVFLIGGDGIGVTQITANGADNYAPAISPDRTEIAFTSTLSGNDDVWVMNIDGTGLRQLTFKPGFDGYPAWSPDGTKIAFQSDRSGSLDVFTINASGTGVKRLTFKPGVDERPSWSPDGSRIAFDTTRSGNYDIYTIGASGASVKRLTFKPGVDRRPDWSPAGSTIAFQSDRTGNDEIWVIGSDGTGVSQVTDDPAADFTASWSPDGTKLTFASSRAEGTQLFASGADGADPSQYTLAGTINELPSWG